MARALRHPLVVGAALALLSGVLASLLIPALTRVWQDRPRELSLKRSLVEQISTAATQAVQAGESHLLKKKGRPNPKQPDADFIRLRKPWVLKSSIVTAELTTYFRDDPVLDRWREFAEAVRNYLGAVAYQRNGQVDPGFFSELRKHFGLLHFSESTAERHRNDFVRHGRWKECSRLLCAARLLEEERDELSRSVVDAHAAGYSRGWWIFK